MEKEVQAETYFKQLEPSICLGDHCGYWPLKHCCVGCSLVHATVDVAPFQGSIPYAKLRTGQTFIHYGDEFEKPGERASSSVSLFLADHCLNIIYEFKVLRREYGGMYHAEGVPAWFSIITSVMIEF